MISEFVEYVKQAWKNKPNVSSPLNADRLNHMEAGIENNSKKIKETVTAVNELTEKKVYTISDVTALNGATIKEFNAVRIGNFALISLRIIVTKVNIECIRLPFSSGFPVAYPIDIPVAWDKSGKTGYFQFGNNTLFATNSTETNTDYYGQFVVCMK